MNYLDWELFIRERELTTYKVEKEKRKNLYLKLQKVIQECKEESKQTKEKLQNLIQEKIFGDTDLRKLKLDYRIPPQHNIQFYLKACNPAEFETFYNNSEFYLSKLINRTNLQVEYLHKIKANPKWAESYEKKNYVRFLGENKIEELKKEYQEKMIQEKNTNIFGINVALRKFDMQNDEKDKIMNNEIKILKVIDDHIKTNNYNKFNLTSEQKTEINKLRKFEIIKQYLEKESRDIFKPERKQIKIKTQFYENNNNVQVDQYNLTYNQRMSFKFDHENILNQFNQKDFDETNKQIMINNTERNYINNVLERKKIEDSLRRKRKDHLMPMKNPKKSLDRYNNEDEYYTLNNFTKGEFKNLKEKMNRNQDSGKI